jgi:uncharacterized membrane protein YphA (DoxX/SURF4 family)
VAGALLLMHGVRLDSHWTTLLAGFLLAGAGIGMINPALASTAIGVVPPQRSGMASGINNTCRQVGISTGIAALGAIFQHSVTQKLKDTLPAAARGKSEQLSKAVASGATQVFEQAPAPIRQAARESFLAGFNHILLVGSGVAIAGSIAAVLLVRTRDFVTAPGADGAPAPEAAPAHA